MKAARETFDTTSPYIPNDREEGILLLERSGYKHNPRCSICVARSPVTKMPIRADIEEVIAKSGTTQALNYLKGFGINIGIRQLQRHVVDHAPYLRGGLWLQRTREFIKDAIEEHSDAETSIQNIINIGNKMIQDGQMPVTEKLYMEALKINQKSRAAGSMKGFIHDVEEGMFQEGKTVESIPEVPEVTAPPTPEIPAPVEEVKTSHQVDETPPVLISEPKEDISIAKAPTNDPGALQEVVTSTKSSFKLPFSPESVARKKRK